MSKSKAQALLAKAGGQQHSGSPIWCSTKDRFDVITNVPMDKFSAKSDFIYVDCQELESNSDVIVELTQFIVDNGDFEWTHSSPREYSEKSDKSGHYIKIYPSRS